MQKDHQKSGQTFEDFPVGHLAQIYDRPGKEQCNKVFVFVIRTQPPLRKQLQQAKQRLQL